MTNPITRKSQGFNTCSSGVLYESQRQDIERGIRLDTEHFEFTGENEASDPLPSSVCADDEDVQTYSFAMANEAKEERAQIQRIKESDAIIEKRKKIPTSAFSHIDVEDEAVTEKPRKKSVTNPWAFFGD